MNLVNNLFKTVTTAVSYEFSKSSLDQLNDNIIYNFKENRKNNNNTFEQEFKNAIEHYDKESKKLCEDKDLIAVRRRMLGRNLNRIKNNKEELIYVLQLQNNKYYIGKTTNIDKRIEEHKNGNGSVWTNKHKFISLIETYKYNDKFDEDKYTKEYMSKYGIENVRGGSYTTVTFDKQTFFHLKKEIYGAENKCYKCGESGHYANNCNTNTFTESYNLFQSDNLSIEDISKLRNLAIMTVENHLVEAYKKGLRLDLERLGFSNELFTVISKKYIELDKPNKLRTIKKELPDCSYLHIKLALAKMNLHPRKLKIEQNNYIL